MGPSAAGPRAASRPPTWRPAMTHTEREWRDGQPEGAGLDESTSPDRPAQPAGPLAERVPADDRLVGRAGADDPLLERAGAGDPLVEHTGEDVPLAEEVPAPAGLASAGDQERFVARWQEIQAG